MASRFAEMSSPSAFSCLEIDHEFELGRLFHGQISRLCALENAIDVDGRLDETDRASPVHKT
jgi:hypothetical protein